MPFGSATKMTWKARSLLLAALLASFVALVIWRDAARYLLGIDLLEERLNLCERDADRAGYSMKERITLEIPSVLRQDESNDREVNRQGRVWWVSKPAEPYPVLKRCPFCGGTTSRCRSAAKAIEFWNRRFTGYSDGF